MQFQLPSTFAVATVSYCSTLNPAEQSKTNTSICFLQMMMALMMTIGRMANGATWNGQIGTGTATNTDMAAALTATAAATRD